MKHSLNPTVPLMAQLRDMGLPEHLPARESLVYRFFDAADHLLYVGVTMSPRGRWQAHKRSSAWWAEVRTVRVEMYAHERAALDAELKAIKSERPAHNRRSAHASLMRNSCAAHEDRMRPADIILPRVGGGVGGGVEGLVTHAYNLTLGAVDNPATSRTTPHPEARCMRGKPREIGGGSCQ